MKHEHQDHFLKSEIDQKLRTARADQIKRLLKDIGFLPRTAEPSTVGNPNEEH